MMKNYIVDTISKEDLEYYGYDSSLVSDETMKKIAENLRYTFRECVLVCLPEIADYLNIPLKTEEEEEEKKKKKKKKKKKL